MRFFFYFILLLSICLSVFFSPRSSFAQDFAPYTNSPWPRPYNFPCSATKSYPEFHPLRPYPGNPCDPLIPIKNPDAPTAIDPADLYLTFDCAKSMNLYGNYKVSDVVDICGSSVWDPNGNYAALTNYPDKASKIFRCSDTGMELCQLKRIDWDVAINLKNSELPIIGNSQTKLNDDVKVNQYLDWYLNGTLFQSEGKPDIPIPVSDAFNTRISTFSGPVNKFIPQDVNNNLKAKVSTTGYGRGSQYHDYLLGSTFTTNGDVTYRLSDINGTVSPWITRYMPYSTQEDTTGEVTVSVADAAQPISPEIDGQILSIYLTINVPTDSRLYFAHMKDDLALTELLNSVHTPIETPFPPSPTPRPPNATPPFYFTPTWANQRVTRHQGIDDTTTVQCERYYLGSILTGCSGPGQLIRNTEVREGNVAPDPLYAPPFPNWRCTAPESKSNKGDSFLGRTINGTLTYYQLFRWTPLRVIECPTTSCHGATVVDPNTTTPAPGCINVACSKEGQSCDDNWQSSGNGCCYTQCNYITACYYAGGACVGSSQCDGENAPLSQSECSNHSNPGDCCKNNYGNGSSSDVCCARHRDNRTTYACGTNPSAPAYCIYYNFDCGSFDNTGCSSNSYSCCSVNPTTDYGTPLSSKALPTCSMWPTRNLKSAARMNPYTKTPLIEKIYDLLVLNPQSLLHRWLPELPLSSADTNSLKSGITDTIPGTTQARYIASTSDLTSNKVTAGTGGSGALYFPYLGSMSNYILGIGNTGTDKRENYNLQRLLRPKGFVDFSTGANGTNGVNCDQTVPDQGFSCVDRANYISLAHRWAEDAPNGDNAEQCFNDVVAQANANGVNPGFALLIWLNESGASNYVHNPNVEDFGQHVGQYNHTHDFNTQITGFWQNIDYITSRCSSYFGTYGFAAYAAIFLTGDSCIPNSADTAYANMLETEWTWISSCPFPFPPK